MSGNGNIKPKIKTLFLFLVFSAGQAKPDLPLAAAGGGRLPPSTIPKLKNLCKIFNLGIV
jgi:hypothetical protein